MNNYITGKIIKELREKEQLTQIDLADIINVSDKTIYMLIVTKMD